MDKRIHLILILPLLAALYWGNLRPFMASRALARGDFKEALSYRSFVSYEVRKEMAQEAQGSNDPGFVRLAKDEIEKEIEKRPRDVKLYIHLTYLCFRLGDQEGAVRAAEKAIELAPNRQDLKKVLEEIEGRR